MFSSADLIDALRRRTRRSLRPQAPAGSYPPGWQHLFDALVPRTGAVTGASPQAVMAEMAKREPSPPMPLEVMGRWRASATLWRTDWHPRSRDERGDRWLAQGLTGVLHLFYLVVFAWLLFARVPMSPEERAAASAGEEAIQVDYIVEAIPQVQESQAAPDAAATPSSAPPSSRPEATVETAQSAPAAPAPAPAEPAPAAAPSPPQDQPLQVTEVAVPDSSFTVPPPRITERTPEVRRPTDVDVPDRAVELRETPVARAPVTPREPVVEARPREVTLVDREVPTPTPQARERTIALRPVDAPDVRTPTREVAVRDVPSPAPTVRERTPSTTREASAPRATPAAPAVSSREIAIRPRPAPPEAAGATPAPTAGRAPTPAPAPAPATGAGTRPAPGAPGTTPAPAVTGTPRAGDDWSRPAAGAGRAPGTPGRPGGSSRLFNPDGSPRLADGTAAAGGGLPPGTITEDYEKIDRMGTWVKRPGSNYEPTRFDSVWVPHENLLEEWVRKGVKAIEIPVPGTSKRIVCAVSILQLGGGCGIRDPNLNDQEATARPPPDVPWKPELQEQGD